MGAHGSVQVETVKAQSEAFLREFEAVIVLAGKNYARVAQSVWPHAQTPLVGLGGIGYQRQALSRIIKAQEQPMP